MKCFIADVNSTKESTIDSAGKNICQIILKKSRKGYETSRNNKIKNIGAAN